MKITTEVKGLRELQKLLTGQALYAKPWRDGMEDIAFLSGQRARARAPQRRGSLRGSIEVRVQKRPFPTWLAVRVRARRKSYPYPRLLEYSAKYHHKGWLRSAIDPVWRDVGQVLARIGADIARKWAGGIV